MKSSLQRKLIWLVGIAISLAALPTIYLSRAYLLENGIERERASFANTIAFVEHSLNERYISLFYSEIRALILKKNYFFTEARMIEDLLRAKGMQKEDILRGWRQTFGNVDSRLEFFDEEGRAFFDDPFVAQLTAPGKVDLKGQSIQDKLKKRPANANGENIVISYTDKDGKPSSSLITLWPMKGIGCLAIATQLTSTQKNLDEIGKLLAEGIQNKLNEQSLCEGGFIAILSNTKEILANKGPCLPFVRLTEGMLATVKERRSMEGRFMTVRGEFLYHITYFGPLGWYVVSAAPVESIAAPAEKLTRHLIYISIALMGAILLIMFVFTLRAFTPLKQLTDKARKLAATDFRAQGQGFSSELAEGLPLHRQDEVGQLASTFAHMVKALEENIRRLMDTMAVQQRMEGELNAARDIQMGILTPADKVPSVPGYKAEACLLPAKEVGGDLYDFFTAPDGRQCVVIGDVSDKGVPAALFMAMTVTLVRSAISEGLSCAEAMHHINERLSANNPSCMFVTLFIGLFDPQTGRLEYASGAHCPPMIVSPDAACPVRVLTATSGPLVGVMEGLNFTTCEAELRPGEYCLLYTDGVSEAMNEAGELFSEARLSETLADLRGLEPHDVLFRVEKAVEDHRGTAAQSDDITMLCFRRT